MELLSLLLLLFYSTGHRHCSSYTVYFIVYCFVCQKCTNQIKSNYLNSHGEEAQEKPPGL